jgi:hypothetical protein
MLPHLLLLHRGVLLLPLLLHLVLHLVAVHIIVVLAVVLLRGLPVLLVLRRRVLLALLRALLAGGMIVLGVVHGVVRPELVGPRSPDTDGHARDCSPKLGSTTLGSDSLT